MKQIIWIYRGLILIACALFFISFVMPWWSTHITIQGFAQQLNAVQIFGYGLKHTLLQYKVYILDDETPLWQTILAFLYMIVSLVLVNASTWIKNKKGFWLLFICGLGYIIYILAATYIISQRLDTFGLILQGETRVSFNVRNVTFQSALRPGYYLAFASGVILVILAFLRDAFMKKYRRIE